MPDKPRAYDIPRGGVTKIKNHELQRAQAAMVVAKRIAG